MRNIINLCSYFCILGIFFWGNSAVYAQTSLESKRVVVAAVPESELAENQTMPSAQTASMIKTIAGQPANLQTPPNQGKTQLSLHIQKIDKAIESFRSMGVGVAPFEQLLRQVKVKLAAGNVAESQAELDHLTLDLQDQQKRFYSDKLRVWRTQRKNLIAARAAARKNGGLASESGQPEAVSGMSKSASGVLSRVNGDYKPLIYPIAR